MSTAIKEQELNEVEQQEQAEFDAAMDEIFDLSERLAALYEKTDDRGAACVTRLLPHIALSDLAPYNLAVLHRIAGLMVHEDEDAEKTPAALADEGATHLAESARQ